MKSLFFKLFLALVTSLCELSQEAHAHELPDFKLPSQKLYAWTTFRSSFEMDHFYKKKETTLISSKESRIDVELRCSEWQYYGHVYATFAKNSSYLVQPNWTLGFDHGFFRVCEEGLEYARLKFSGDFASYGKRKNAKRGGCNAAYYLSPYLRIATGPSWWQDLPATREWQWQFHVGFEFPLVP